MFVPVGDSPNLPKTPWVTWALVAVNVAVHLALWPAERTAARRDDPALEEYVQVLLYERSALPQAVSVADLVRFEHGFRPAHPEAVDALTAMFLHGGWLHLLGNMLFLWIFGDNVEHRLGKAGFLLAYLGTGVAAAGGDALLRWGSDLPSVGASGAISGVLGMYFAWFPRNRVRVWVFLFPFFMDTVELPARWVLGFYLVVDNLLPVLLGGQDGVSHGAHIGGFVGGWVLARFVGEAARERRGAPAERPSTAADALAFAEALERRGEARSALSIYQRALAGWPRSPLRGRLHLGAARVLLRAFASPTAAYQHLWAAMEESRDPADEAEARELLDEIRRGTRNVPRRAW